MNQTIQPVNLDNCDREPIHTPGFIQPHGALFAFDAQWRLTWRSANAQALLACAVPAPGDTLSRAHFTGYPDLHQLIADVQASPDGDVLPHAMFAEGPGGAFDVIAYRTAAGVICEFESHAGAAPLPPGFSFTSHRAMERLKREQTVDGLLRAAVEEVRRWTGFDRVMAYRFRHDDSGDVVAESVSDALDPFLGRRYPASDIPAQARRLYVINTVRLIADVRAAPVPVMPHDASDGPLDMSHGTLRSVSPIHIEYLNNMGVSASMSVSIVIGGKLWGMLACHHMAPRRVPYAVRMTCDVLAQVLAANLQGILANESSARAHAAASLRSRVVEEVLHANDIVRALSQEAGALCEGFKAHGLVVADGNRVIAAGGLPQAAAAELVDWLNASARPAGRLLYMNALDGLPPSLLVRMDVWCGLLALPFGTESRSWLLLLRKEQVETVMWGGKPEKAYASGPLGPRLTPRGSFDLWKEIVRGKAVPWDEADLDNAQKLLDELVRADSTHSVEISRARQQLMAMLGHDLRSPIQAISLTAELMQMRGGDSSLSSRLHSSSSRMQRLVEQVMDMSQMHSGLLKFSMQPFDLAALARQMLAESRAAHPGVAFDLAAPTALNIAGDADRIAQVLSNLLGNASHYGMPGEQVLVRIHQEDGCAVIEVSNASAPIPPELASTLFRPFKRIAGRITTNRNGLGLGLYITEQIVAGHHGTLAYSYKTPMVTFTATLPLLQPV